MKNGKTTLGFRIYKIWQILKPVTGTFRRAQTLKLGGVICWLLRIYVDSEKTLPSALLALRA